MDIVVDIELDAHGEVIARHTFQTERLDWNVCDHPDGITGKISAIDAVKLRHEDQTLLPGTGWEIITKLPQYAGKTRHEVLIAEIVRLDDPIGREVLGI